MKAGDKVVITRTLYENYPFFSVGDYAILEKMDDGGDWWADFSINDSVEGDGCWCLQQPVCEFKLVEEH